MWRWTWLEQGRKTRPERVAFVGSIKWRERTALQADVTWAASRRSATRFRNGRRYLLIGVSREGFDEQGRGLDVVLDPEDLLEAWKQ